MEYYQQTKRDKDKKETKKSPEKKSSYPLSFKLKQAFLLSVLGAGFLTSCGVVENRAKAIIDAAGIPAAVANDPDLIWAAMNGATAEELRSHANSLLMQYERESSQARETQMAFDAANQAPQITPETKQEEVVEQSIALEQVGERVYSFRTDDNIEITSKDFIRKVRISLGQPINTEINRVFVAVPDDDFGVTRIFMDSTVESYKNVNGIFYAYPGDVVYVSTDINSLTNFLNAQGINHETFGLP